MSVQQQTIGCRNSILSTCGPAVFERFELERISTRLGETLQEEREPAEWAYFPENAVVSVICVLQDGRMIEIGVIGYDGVVGIQAISNPARQPYRNIVQGAGDVWRMPMKRLQNEFHRDEKFQQILLDYYTQFLFQVSQTAACNRLHNLEPRLARWLLMMRDRKESDLLTLTQEFLSHMLGTRIAGVNEAVQEFRRSGLITTGRGTITITDREGLETAACECYDAIRISPLTARRLKAAD